MVAYELGQQIDGYRDMLYEIKQVEFQRSIFDRCFTKWNRNSNAPEAHNSINWHMIAYCYKQTIKGR